MGGRNRLLGELLSAAKTSFLLATSRSCKQPSAQMRSGGHTASFAGLLLALEHLCSMMLHVFLMLRFQCDPHGGCDSKFIGLNE